jgi:hypothetical protein
MIRCPRCDLTHPDTATVCARCGADLRVIVVGYPDRDALATDRESLERDGWQIVEIKEQTEGPAFSVRYQRGPAADPFAHKAPSAKSDHVWVRGLVVFAVLAALAAGIVLGRTTASRSSSAVAAQPAPASLIIEGADGVSFTGSITGPDSTDKVQGKTPQTFHLEPAGTYTAVIQKLELGLSLLTVTLTCSNGTRFSSSTAAMGGIISVSGQCG